MKPQEPVAPIQSPAADFPACVVSTRRAKGITQSALANEVSCKQSAISMFERGNEQALSLEKQVAIASYLGIDWAFDAPSPPAPPTNAPPAATSYCPHFDCPANMPYQIGPRCIAMPRQDLVQQGKHCRYCGEICETHCPHCNSPYEHGAHCRHCGSPYIPWATAERSAEEWTAWIAAQQKLILRLS